MRHRYLDKVVPSSDGTRRHPLFCFGFKRSLDMPARRGWRCCSRLSAYASLDTLDDDSSADNSAKPEPCVEPPSPELADVRPIVSLRGLTKLFPRWVP